MLLLGRPRRFGDIDGGSIVINRHKFLLGNAMSRYARKLPPLDACPFEHVIEILGGKWKGRILHYLSGTDATMGEIGRHLPRARPQVLRAQLLAMEESGILVRLPAEDGKDWGRYRLTPRGRELCAALDPLITWSSRDLGGWPLR